MSLTKLFSPTGIGSTEESLYLQGTRRPEPELELDWLEYQLSQAMVNYSREHGDQALMDYVENWLYENGIKR